MLWAISTITNPHHLHRGVFVGVLIADERIQVAHHVLVHDHDTDSFVGAAIVVSIDPTITISIFKTWPTGTMFRKTMMSFVASPHPANVLCAPMKNLIPIPHKDAFVAMARTSSNIVFKAYAEALSDGSLS